MSAQELPYTYQELAACAKREAGKRRGFYPKLVASDKMSSSEAELEIDKMQTMANYFECLAALPPVQYATSAQREEIIRLLNHPLITRPEKTKMLLAINRLDFDRATSSIANIRQAIELREDWPQPA